MPGLYTGGREIDESIFFSVANRGYTASGRRHIQAHGTSDSAAAGQLSSVGALLVWLLDLKWRAEEKVGRWRSGERRERRGGGCFIPSKSSERGGRWARPRNAE